MGVMKHLREAFEDYQKRVKAGEFEYTNGRMQRLTCLEWIVRQALEAAEEAEG